MNTSFIKMLGRMVEVAWNSEEKLWECRWAVEAVRHRATVHACAFANTTDTNTPAKAAIRFCGLNRLELAELVDGSDGPTAAGYVTDVDAFGAPVKWLFLASDVVVTGSLAALFPADLWGSRARTVAIREKKRP